MATGPVRGGTSSGLRGEPAAGAHAVSPLFDVYETETAFVLVADVPGVRPEGLEVTAEREILTIRGRVERAPRPPEHQEYELADYLQTLSLTEDMDATKVNASLKDGVLRLTIPKSPSIQPKRITVRTE